MLHDRKTLTNNALCAACESVFLCAASKLTATFAREGPGIQQKPPQQNVIKRMDTKKIISCQALFYVNTLIPIHSR